LSNAEVKKTNFIIQGVPSKHNPESFPPLLRECWNKLNSTFMHRVKRVGLTPDQYIALRWIHEFPVGEISQVKLAELMFTDSNNIAGLMKRMEGLKLIVRKTNSSDLRKKHIFQTSHGSVQFKKGKKIAEQLENVALSCFSTQEKTHFLTLLNQLSKTINDQRKALF
jgi:DNA-binding MarR family transcriptional regulator